MFNTFKKTSIALLMASTALVQIGCNNDDAEADKLGNWYRDGIPSFGGSARARAVSFQIGDKGYVGTGLTNETVSRVQDFWSYNAAAKIWSQTAAFPGTGRTDAVSFVVGGKAYVGLGYDSNTISDLAYKKDFFAYDPSSNTWSEVAEYIGGTRQYATAFTQGNYGYVGLGYNGSGYYQDFYQYDPTSDSWKEIATFTGGKRRGAVSFTVNGSSYVGFGTSNSGASTSDLYQFNPTGNGGLGAWVKMENDDEDFPSRTHAFALVINEKAYIVGGTGLSDCWEYTPGTNEWDEATGFEGGQRGFAAGFVMGNLGYFGTGSPSGSAGYDDWWAFDPTAVQDDDDN
ncbi:hypothetical protein CLV98_107137 [Dyadobacter jejuensis]|uniref:Galactose oxidase-like protein n=1 Tax=Dyadobacter jejuensis TaxID=1082580 RepID=A0A316AJL4_9BACT|nr:galactose oxidase [Dyadobacter jejuensis]PWJ57429.1 hypothetical protein CLV98_107137 [Dyadobacter jejuensis]